MYKSVVLASFLALASGVSVSTAEAQAAPGLCTKPNEHCITVTIDNDATGAPKINVDVANLTVTGPNHVIFWSIRNTGAQSYTFPGNGIEFKTPAGQGEFKCALNDNSKIVFRCTDPNKTKGTFEYGIKVDGTPGVPPLDPWVINR